MLIYIQRFNLLKLTFLVWLSDKSSTNLIKSNLHIAKHISKLCITLISSVYFNIIFNLLKCPTKGFRIHFT